nr:MAG TPA: hypothetical protein [Caudoviricetes sp.]
MIKHLLFKNSWNHISCIKHSIRYFSFSGFNPVIKRVFYSFPHALAISESIFTTISFKLSRIIFDLMLFLLPICNILHRLQDRGFSAL